MTSTFLSLFSCFNLSPLCHRLLSPFLFNIFLWSANKPLCHIINVFHCVLERAKAPENPSWNPGIFITEQYYLTLSQTTNLMLSQTLTLSQTTNFRLFQIERVCRQQFQIWWKWQKNFQMGRKQCGKRRNCSLWAIFPFPTVFSKDLYCRHVKTRACLGKGW